MERVEIEVEELKKLIVEAINAGNNSINEISYEVKVPYDNLCKAIVELQMKGVIENKGKGFQLIKYLNKEEIRQLKDGDVCIVKCKSKMFVGNYNQDEMKDTFIARYDEEKSNEYSTVFNALTEYGWQGCYYNIYRIIYKFSEEEIKGFNNIRL